MAAMADGEACVPLNVTSPQIPHIPQSSCQSAGAPMAGGGRKNVVGKRPRNTIVPDQFREICRHLPIAETFGDSVLIKYFQVFQNNGTSTEFAMKLLYLFLQFLAKRGRKCKDALKH
ncbi:hypothetical protein [Camelimonas lactis]|uniref:hypothetical protein n=1 Tax=Camelimonas lactis TaxID=659006 RepID=UPI00140466ED|nr:hypothetical protein [Camelimonas lactis]